MLCESGVAREGTIDYNVWIGIKRTFEHNEKFNEKNFIDKLHYCHLMHLRIFIAAVFNIIDGFRLRNLIFSHPPKGIKTGF